MIRLLPAALQKSFVLRTILRSGLLFVIPDHHQQQPKTVNEKTDSHAEDIPQVEIPVAEAFAHRGERGDTVTSEDGGNGRHQHRRREFIVAADEIKDQPADYRPDQKGRYML